LRAWSLRPRLGKRRQKSCGSRHEYSRQRPGAKVSAFARRTTGRRLRKAIEIIPGGFVPGRMAIRFSPNIWGRCAKISQLEAKQKAKRLKLFEFAEIV